MSPDQVVQSPTTEAAVFFRLHSSDINCRQKADSAGFTLIETLIVVLVIGILCATGVSMYAGATSDSQLRSLQDEMNGFFTACRHRVIMRKTPVRVLYQNRSLGIEQSSTLKLRIPELSQESGNYLNGLVIEEKGMTLANGRKVSKIDLNLYLPGKRLATMTLEL